jgi:hypothetical protein
MPQINEQAKPARNGGGDRGRTVTAILEPPLGPVPRSELVDLLRVARPLLADVAQVRGGFLRRCLVAQIDLALAREPREPAPPAPHAVIDVEPRP